MSFHSLRCLICLADVSIIPSVQRCGLPLQGGFRGDRRLIPLAIARLGGFLLALLHPLVEPTRAAELLVAAWLGDPAVVEQHNLTDLVELIALARDERDGPAFGGVQQVRGECLMRLWVEVGSSRISSSWHGLAAVSGDQLTVAGGSCQVSRSGSSRSASFGPQVPRA